MVMRCDCDVLYMGAPGVVLYMSWWDGVAVAGCVAVCWLGGVPCLNSAIKWLVRIRAREGKGLEGR